MVVSAVDLYSDFFVEGQADLEAYFLAVEGKQDADDDANAQEEQVKVSIVASRLGVRIKRDSEERCLGNVCLMSVPLFG